MAATVTLFDPTAPRRDAGHGDGQKGRARARLSGAVVGFIDNAKPNFNHLVDDLAALLASKYGVARVIKRRKPSASIAARPEIVEELVDQCDVVITGSGD
ncbi:MAG: hypothetical protein HY526_10390 [Betaproteobacteria bacterium]|nr:hypothetical protein [Betaproteobacteria bacterium]